MAEKAQFVQRFGARFGLAALVAGLGLALLAVPVLAQSRGFSRSGGFFDSFFGPFSGPRIGQSERPTDFTRAPPPRKADTPPTSTVLVLGDSMADWLAYGLEEALADTPELGIVRKHRAGSGLIHYDPRNEAQDWAQAAREAIAATRPQFIVMMVGLNDRQALRARPLTSASATPPGATAAPPLALVPQSGAAPQAEGTSPAQPSIVTPEPPSQSRTGLQTYEFRTEEWAEHYTRHIDATITAMKSAGVPVFWVGLPSLRGPKSTSDMLYLDDLFRSRAEKAGVTYIDVWDGFVDDNGRYVVQGPDFEGQIRRLRVSDGVHFTKAGARKLAHYVEREIRRVTTHGLGPVALPASEAPVQTPSSRPGMPTARPLAGPVLPLTASVTSAQDLLGGGDAGIVNSQPIVARVLVKGEPVTPPAGRSDDFTWPRRAIAPFGKDPVVATTTDPVPIMPAAPAATTVPVPSGDSRAVASTNAKRTTGRASSPPQNRRNSGRFPGIPFIR
jgi:hypothetical protein